MNETKTENVKKKGILATIWDSMTKTGGCCGSGGNCGCGPAKPQASKDGAGPKADERGTGQATQGR